MAIIDGPRLAPKSGTTKQLVVLLHGLGADGNDLIYTFDTQADSTGIAGLLRQLNELGIDFKDLRTEESSLEDIFVNLVSTRR